jgi:hypothetical protein
MTHEERFDRIDANMERLSERLDASVARIDATLARLSEYILEFRQETAQRLEVIENRLDVLTATVANMDSRFPPITRAILDFGKLATQLTN